MIKQALLSKKRPENRIFIDRNRRAFLKSTLEQATPGAAAFFWRNWSHARHSHIVLFLFLQHKLVNHYLVLCVLRLWIIFVAYDLVDHLPLCSLLFLLVA